MRIFDGYLVDVSVVSLHVNHRMKPSTGNLLTYKKLVLAGHTPTWNADNRTPHLHPSVRI